jgi:V/A-type H+-transporting ATPase subunit I
MFLGLAAVVGGLHLLLGTVIAIRLAVLQKAGRALAIGLSDFVLISSFYLLAFSFLGGDENYKVVTAMILGALVIKVVAGGWIELIESSRLVSGILSYARLMAVGVGSIIFADMADDLFFSSDNIVVAVFMLVTIHGFNLMLGIFDPALQALRLHYVEFFSRFYKFGEVRFAPLGNQ